MRWTLCSRDQAQGAKHSLIKREKELKTNPVPDGFVEWEQNVIAESLSRDIESNPFDYINLVSVETLSNVLCSRLP